MIHNIIKKYNPKFGSIYTDNAQEMQSAINVIIDTGYAPYVEKLAGIKLEKDSGHNYENILSVIKAADLSIKLVKDANTIAQYNLCLIPLERLAIFLSWLIVDSYNRETS